MLGCLLAAGLHAGVGVASAQNIAILDVTVNDLIYDPVSQRIYASVPSIAGPDLGNSITTINPMTGEIENSVVVGSEPGPLAISDDGQYLYVGLQAAASIRRYHIPSATPGLQIPLGGDPRWGPYVAEDIEVLPGNPNAVAVSRARLDNRDHVDVVILDDDVMRPVATSPVDSNNRIEFSETASMLYAYNSETSEHGFRRIEVTQDGATVVGVAHGLIFGIHDIEFEQGVIYATSGEAIDPGAMAVTGNYDASGSVAADATLGKVYFLDRGQLGGLELKTFDMATFALIDSLPIEIDDDGGFGLIRWGDDGLAFYTRDFFTRKGHVILIGATAWEPPPLCDVYVNISYLGDGDDVVANTLRFVNPGALPVSVEVRLWLEQWAEPPIPTNDLHPTGVFDLPPGHDRNFGPVTLLTVTPELPRGQYTVTCRLLDPVTGRHIAEDSEPLTIR